MKGFFKLTKLHKKIFPLHSWVEDNCRISFLIYSLYHLEEKPLYKKHPEHA